MLLRLLTAPQWAPTEHSGHILRDGILRLTGLGPAGYDLV